MTKFKYSTEGLYNPNRSSIDSSISEITSSIELLNVGIPDSFSYKNYLLSLKDVLGDIKKEMNVVERLLKKADQEYRSMSDGLSNDVSLMTRYTISERERMIL